MDEISKILKKIEDEKDIFSKAKLIAYLLKNKKITVKRLSESLRIKPSYICHINRLNKLPEIIIDGYYGKQLSISYLFLLSRLKDNSDMISLYEEILSKNLTVTETEEKIREIKYKIKDDGAYLNADKKNEMEQMIKKSFPEVSAKIIQTRIFGKITLQIKGNLLKSSEAISKIVKKLT